MKTLKFKNNDVMPALGLGTWKSEPGEVYAAVKTAIKEGYRHIDCAPIYGNEKEVGNAISECINEGIITRKDLWITSKLWNDAHARADVVPALHQTLNDLQADYLDLYLIHWPVALQKGAQFPLSGSDFVSLTKLPLIDTWKGMEECAQLGLTRHIGVSNFGIKALQNILSACQIAPEANQVECHPHFQQNELLDFCKSQGIHFTSYSPLGSSDRPEAMKANDEPSLLENQVILSIAKDHNATVAQVILSWNLHRDTSVIPKSVNPKRIRENLDAVNLQLPEEDMKAIAGIDSGYRLVNGKFWTPEGSPYTLEELWA